MEKKWILGERRCGKKRKGKMAGVEQGNAVEERYDGKLTQWSESRKCRRWKLSITHL